MDDKKNSRKNKKWRDLIIPQSQTRRYKVITSRGTESTDSDLNNKLKDRQLRHRLNPLDVT